MLQSSAASFVVNDVLDRTGQALMEGDFDTFVSYFVLPQRIETIEGQLLVDTPEKLETLFASVRGFHRRMGINRIVRSCTTAEFKGARNVEGVFKSLFFKNSTIVHRIPASFVLLTQEEEGWQIRYNMYGINNADAFGSALMHAPPLRVLRGSARRKTSVRSRA